MSFRPSKRTPALLDTRALIALLAGGVTAWATGLWWLLLPAGLLYLWLVRAAFVEVGDPFAWVEPDLRALQPPYQARVEPTLEVLRRLNAEMRTAPAYLRETTGTVWNEVRTLGERQLFLVGQLQSVEEYLARLNLPQLRAQDQELQARQKAARDPVAIQQYEQARQALRGQAQNVQDLKATADRIDAQLRTVQLELENVYGQVLRMKAAEPSNTDAAMHDLNAGLQGVSRQVGSLSEAVEQVYVRSTGRNV